jgi:hypothetical protein
MAKKYGQLNPVNSERVRQIRATAHPRSPIRSQLDDEIRDAVLGNCSTLVSFRVGAKDAPIIAAALDWSEQDCRIAAGLRRVRTLIDGKPSSAYLMETERTELPTGELDRNITRTRARYSRERRMVEQMMRAPQTKRGRSW